MVGRNSSLRMAHQPFVRERNRVKSAEEQRIHRLEDKLHRKHEVLSELLEEHIHLKK